MNRLLVIGDPVEGSLSPVMHNAALEYMGLDRQFEYGRKRVGENELKDIIRDMRISKIYGVNVTIPLKVDIIDHVDRVTARGKAAGAVNTVYKKDGLLIGDNTDCLGFVRSLKEEGVDVRGKRAMVLGAGGAARGVVYGLCSMEVGSIVVANRTVENATDLEEHLKPHVTQDISVVPLDEAEYHLKDTDILVNTTALGMKGLAEDISPISTRGLYDRTVVVDIVYRPRETKLIRGAKKKGCRTVNGIGMLVHQGAAALELWTGREVPADVMKRALLEHLEESG